MLSKMQCPMCNHATIAPIKVSYASPGLVLEPRAEGAGGVGAIATNHLPKILKANARCEYVYLTDAAKGTKAFRGVTITSDFKGPRPELGDEVKKCACCGHNTLMQNTTPTNAMWPMQFGIEHSEEEARLLQSMPEGDIRVEQRGKQYVVTPKTSATAPAEPLMNIEELRELAIMAGCEVGEDSTADEIKAAMEEKKRQRVESKLPSKSKIAGKEVASAH